MNVEYDYLPKTSKACGDRNRRRVRAGPGHRHAGVAGTGSHRDSLRSGDSGARIHLGKALVAIGARCFAAAQTQSVVAETDPWLSASRSGIPVAPVSTDVITQTKGAAH